MKKTTTARIAIFSDIHLGVHCDSPVWHKISKEWVYWFATKLKENNIQDIIFCGDYFHDRSAVAVNTMHVASDIINELKDFNVFMLPGNHDCMYRQKADVHSISVFKGLNNVTVFDDIGQISIGDNCVATLVPWSADIGTVPQCDIIFGHFEIQTFRMNSYKICESGVEIKELMNKAPHIISGHFHFRDEREFQNGKITYVGNPFQMDLNDSGNVKGFYILDGDTKELSFVENTISPKIFKIYLSKLVDGNVQPDALKSIITSNIIRFIVDIDIEHEDSEFIVDKLHSFNPLQLNIEYTKVDDGDNLYIEDDLSGIDIEKAINDFIDLLDVDERGAVLTTSLELYNMLK